jgi:hypothetical protein
LKILKGFIENVYRTFDEILDGDLDWYFINYHFVLRDKKYGERLGIFFKEHYTKRKNHPRLLAEAKALLAELVS